MPPSSLTLGYDAVLATTFFNWSKTLFDTISKSNYFLFHLMKEVESGWDLIDDIGDRAAMPLMYEIGTADSYSGYDILYVTPTDGITAAFYDWREASVPISISGLEEQKNKGESRMLNLLEAKTKQAELGMQDFFNKSLLQGNGGSAITTAYTSAMNGSQFLDPLPLVAEPDPQQHVEHVQGVPQGPPEVVQRQLEGARRQAEPAPHRPGRLRTLRGGAGRPAPEHLVSARRHPVRQHPVPREAGHVGRVRAGRARRLGDAVHDVRDVVDAQYRILEGEGRQGPELQGDPVPKAGKR